MESKKLYGKVLFLNFYLRLSMKKSSLYCCYCQFLVFILKNSSPPLIRIQNCHQKQDLGCKNPNFVKRVIWRIFDLLFWKNTCFSLFFFNFGVNLLKYAPTHTNDCSSLKKINKKRKQNIPKLSSAQSTVGRSSGAPQKVRASRVVVPN